MNDLNHSPDRDGLALPDFSDDELAAAAAVGDPDAFDELVGRSAPVVLRYIRRLVDDGQAAEDLAQETMLALWRGLPDFGFRSSVRTWLFGVAHRKVADYYRRRREVPTVDERFADLASVQPLPSDEAERSELVDALRSELRRLPPPSRAVWWLREVEGLSLTEIGQVTGLTNGSVRGHLQRSRSYLATRLAPWKPGAPSGTPPGDGAAAGADRDGRLKRREARLPEGGDR